MFNLTNKKYNRYFEWKWNDAFYSETPGYILGNNNIHVHAYMLEHKKTCICMLEEKITI